MTPFLMLFAGVRQLHEEKMHLISEVARLTGEAAASQARAEEAEKHVEDIKRVADAGWFQATRRNVFAKAEAPVAPAVPEMIPGPRRVMARDVAAQRTREALLKQRQGVMDGLRAEAKLTEESQTA